MRIITERHLQELLKEAYEQGLNIRETVDCQTKIMDEHCLGTIMHGYDMDKDLKAILNGKRWV